MSICCVSLSVCVFVVVALCGVNCWNYSLQFVFIKLSVLSVKTANVQKLVKSIHKSILFINYKHEKQKFIFDQPETRCNSVWIPCIFSVVYTTISLIKPVCVWFFLHLFVSPLNAQFFLHIYTKSTDWVNSLLFLFITN